MIKPPILITGCARSGTSMTAGVVNICGAWGGECSGPTRYNKRGMFENAGIRNNLIKPLLRAMGVDPMGQYPLPDPNHITIQNGNAEQWRNSILRHMRREGLKDDQPWFYKGAKLCLIWPLWHRAFPDAKWIIIRRADEGIINSCLKTSFMHAFDNAEGWQWWVNQHKLRFREMYESHLNMVVTYPAKMIAGDFSEMESVIDWLGLTWDERQVKEFISPDLWHHKEKVNA